MTTMPNIKKKTLPVEYFADLANEAVSARLAQDRQAWEDARRERHYNQEQARKRRQYMLRLGLHAFILCMAGVGIVVTSVGILRALFG